MLVGSQRGPFIPPETGNPKLSCRIVVLNTSLV